MPPSIRSGVRSSDRLEALLNDLGPQVKRGGEHVLEALAPLPSGLAVIDDLLGGGFPGGRISEIVGPVSSGRTSLCLALLATTTRRAGELVAVVDHVDAFDPLSAEAAGVDLDRVLWVRVDDPNEALRCTERLLETEGIPLTLLDLRTRLSLRPLSLRPASLSPLSLRPPSLLPASRLSSHPDPRPGPAMRTGGIGKTAWLRLARLAAGTHSALVVLTTEHSVGPQAEVVLEMQPARPHFRGTPTQLEAVELQVKVVRHRTGPGVRSATFCLDASAIGSDIHAARDAARDTAQDAPRGPRER